MDGNPTIGPARRHALIALLLTALIGCSGGSTPDDTSTADGVSATAGSTATDSKAASASSRDGADRATADTDSGTGSGSDRASGGSSRTYAPIQLPGAASATAPVQSEAGSEDKASEPASFEDMIAGLKPLQILLGNWTGIVQKASSNEAHAWVWDLKSDPQVPALVLDAPEGQFFRHARLTYDPRSKQFHMMTRDADNQTREYSGSFTQPPRDIPNEDGKGTYRTFKLELAEVTQPAPNVRYRFLFNQQNNNRYLVEVGRARGRAPFRRFDTIGTQRDGVSFARADDDYGERTCIISGGLGTMTVSWKGRSYYVCCSGCKAAFEDDPERWIARFEAEKKKKAAASN